MTAKRRGIAEFPRVVQVATPPARPARNGRRNRHLAGTVLVGMVGVNRSLMLAVCLLLIGFPASGTRKAENYPKVLVYSSAIGQLPEATQDSLSWYDVLVSYDRPEVIRSLRTRNPGLRCLWSIQPQFATPPAGENPWWLPDTLWSASRLVQLYAERNNWYLRDTSGQPITDGSAYALNWTRYCPAGTFGSSKGLRPAEWIASVALPQIALSGRYWDAWSWNSHTAYNGIMFEILADCLGSYGWRTYAQADPNQDGVAEGVYSACSTNGSNDPLSVLMREENEIFYARLRAAFPADFVFVMNENNRFIGPAWRTQLSGMKLENWMRSTNSSWNDWWDWFYGLTPPWLPGDNWGSGYAWAESAFDGPAPAELRGWDLSFIQVWKEPGRPDSDNRRQMRWGLGTAMLGDGYFAYTKDQKYPLWQPEFDWDFGTPLGGYTRELQASGDTLYVRLFSRGMVEVNPYSEDLAGVPSRDSRFTFWLPVQDLAAHAIDGQSIEATWTAPDGSQNDADSFELRYSTAPIILENWAAAVPYSGGPITAPPGSAVTVTIEDLDAGKSYFLAVRTKTRGRREPLLSNGVQVNTPVLLDLTPPRSITDLHVPAAGQNWIQLAWTAPGDDGASGTATRYLLRYLADESIVTVQDWNRATPAGGLPSPRPAGAAESYFLSGLSPGHSYGIAVRAADEGGLLSPLHSPVQGQTSLPPPPDTTPPGAIANLHGTAGASGEIRLSWTAPGDDGDQGRATSYAVRFLADRAVAGEGDWQIAATPRVGVPTPHASGTTETMSLLALTPGRAYGVAVRAMDDAGNTGALSNPVLANAGVEDPPPPQPPDTIAPGAIDDLTASAVGDTFAVLQWTATGGDGETGSASHYELRILAGSPITSETLWSEAVPADSSLLPVPLPAGTLQSCTVANLLPGQTYGAALRARDEAGNLGALPAGLLFETTSPPPPPPLPPPPQAPAAVTDLRQAAAETTAVLLVWTAPAATGDRRVSRYLLRMAAEGTPDSSLWTAGTDLAGVPEPGAPGSTDSLLVSGLAPSRRYGFALRSEDGSANISAASNPLWAATADRPPPPPPPPPPASPPGAITDLALTHVSSDSATVAWTAPGDDGNRGRAMRYDVRLRVGAPIASEGDWISSATPDTSGLGRPLPAGGRQEWVLANLVPESTYSLAIRAVDDSSLIAPLSNPLQWTTGALPTRVGPGAVVDLASPAQGADWIELSWSSPALGSDGSSAFRYALRVRPGGREIASEQDWAEAEEVSGGLPLPGRPGEDQTCRISGLSSSRAYAVALRAEDENGHAGPLATGPVLITRSGSPSTGPPQGPGMLPAPISDLMAVEVGASWIDLEWTAVGNDSLSGSADRYALRVRRSSTIETEDDWALAEPGEAILPLPALAGGIQSLRVNNLDPGQEYSVAIRAIDSAGWTSPLGAAVRVDIVPYVPLPPPPPAAIDVREITTNGALIEWTQTGAAGEPGGIDSYIIAVAAGPIDETNWAVARKAGVPPRPGEAGETISFRCDSLLDGTEYWAAVRTRSPEGLVSRPLAIVRFTTIPYDLAPPEPPRDLTVLGLADDGRILLRWTPSLSPTLAGYFVYGRSDGGAWQRLQEAPLPAAASESSVPAGSSSFAISAFDGYGNESAMSEAAYAAASGFALRGPYPHPVGSSCRFEIDLPLGTLSSPVSLKIIDSRGMEIRDLLGGFPPQGGFLRVVWDRRDAAGRPAAPGALPGPARMRWSPDSPPDLPRSLSSRGKPRRWREQAGRTPSPSFPAFNSRDEFRQRPLSRVRQGSTAGRPRRLVTDLLEAETPRGGRRRGQPTRLPFQDLRDSRRAPAGRIRLPHQRSHHRPDHLVEEVVRPDRQQDPFLPAIPIRTEDRALRIDVIIVRIGERREVVPAEYRLGGFAEMAQ